MPRKEMEIYSSICYYDRPQIKPLQIVNRDKFPGICGRLSPLKGYLRYFSFHEYSVIY